MCYNFKRVEGVNKMKKTKIICSIGPASSNPDIMCEMVKNGMNVARINFSHATLDERKEVVSSVKKVREMTGENVAILYDTKGPEFRNGVLENDQINLVEGKTIRIVKEKVLGAYREGIKTIYLPLKNKRDIEEVPKEIRNKLEFIYLSNYSELYKKLFIMEEVCN